MATKRDYYDILGVSKNADDAEIKKAFRVLAKKYHPDSNPGDKEAEAKFKEAQEAYAVLSDKDKRKAYDTYGHDAFDANTAAGQSSGFGGFDFTDYSNYSDIFSDIFGDFFGSDIFKDTTGFTSRKKDTEVSIRIDFLEAIKGCEKDVTVDYKELCTSCNGSGGLNGSQPTTCPKCNGQGKIIYKNSGLFRTRETVGDCTDCNGTGKIYKDKCRDCNGTGFKITKKTFRITVPEGIENGMTIRIPGKGDLSSDKKTRGDLLVKVLVTASKEFERDGINIYSQLNLKYSTVTLGGTVRVKTVDGEVELKIKPGTQVGSNIRLKGKGVKDVHSGMRGDHYVTIGVEIPTRLSFKQQELLKQLENNGL